MDNTQPLRSTDIKKRNEKLILYLIYKNNGISQSEIVHQTGLKAPTVFRIFTDLENRGIIVKSGKEAPAAGLEKKGRKPVFYSINKDSFYIIGIDFWSGSASIMLMNFSGSPIFQRTIYFREKSHVEEIMHNLVNLIEAAISESGVETDKILGIGIGAPGKINVKTGVTLHYPRITGMENFDIRERLAQSIDIPLYINNNAAAIAIGEYKYGKAQNEPNLLVFLIRSGVGGTVLYDGVPLSKEDETIMEIGHLSVDKNGRQCSCGARGCLETYIGENVILNELNNVAGIAHMEEAIELLSQKDASVEDIFKRAANTLSSAAVSLYNVLAPDALLIISRYKYLSEYYVRNIENYIEKNNIVIKNNKQLKYLWCEYNPLIACKGAADLVISNFFNVK
jgi:predicted NBD/HSP70 family sugar kinase